MHKIVGQQPLTFLGLSCHGADNLDNIIANRESVMPMKARKALCKEYEQLPSYKRLVLLRTELDHLLTGHVEALDFRVPQVSPFCCSLY
jgi:hypothetical protein